MDYLQKIIKKSGWMSILVSTIFAILGIVLIWKPEETIKVISYILGAIFIIIGIARMYTYFTTRGKNDLYNYDIIFGVLAIILGIVTMIYSNTIGTLLNLIIGIWIIYSSLVRFNIAIKLRKQNEQNRAWIYTLALAIIMFICGLFVILNSKAIFSAIGIAMLVYAIIDIIEQFIFMREVKDIL